MPHEPEDDFDDYVYEWLRAEFPHANIDEKPYLDETGRFPDFMVGLDGWGIAVEVENDWEAVLNGIGQALLYATHEPNYVPMVVVPDGHVEQPEADMLRRAGVTIVEVG